MKIIFFDVEVFEFDWMVGFKDNETKTRWKVWNDSDRLNEILEEIGDAIFVAFNNWGYDDKILELMMDGKSNGYIFRESKSIIGGAFKTYKSRKLFTLDLFRNLKSSVPLKVLESELGLAIEESHIDFDIDRKLTQEEVELTDFYNDSDVDAVEALFEILWRTTIKTKVDLVDYYGLDLKCIQYNTPTIVAMGMKAKKGNHPDKHFKWYDELIIENEEIAEYIRDELYLERSRKFNIQGITHTMGLGGIHGAEPNYRSAEGIIADVVGYYSLIMMNFDLLSRSITDPSSYSTLYEERKVMKAENNPRESALKGGILAVFGATQNERHNLYDKTVGQLIMITGQAFLIDLIEKVIPYANLVQSNTDGIFLDNYDFEKVQEAIDEWSNRTGFEIEIDHYKNLWQKDVNNYVCIINDKKVVAKGGFVNLYNADEPRFDNNLGKWIRQGAIVDKALVNYMLYDIPIEDTVNNETNMRMFQFTARLGKGSKEMYLHTIYDNGIEEYKLVNKVNRLFATKHEGRIDVIKQKKGDSYNLVANMPSDVFIYNGHMKDFDREDEIDREWYIERTKARLDRYLGIEPEKEKKIRKVRIEVLEKSDVDTLLEGRSVLGTKVETMNGMTNITHREQSIRVSEGTYLGDVLNIVHKERKRGIEEIIINEDLKIKMLLVKNFGEVALIYTGNEEEQVIDTFYHTDKEILLNIVNDMIEKL